MWRWRRRRRRSRLQRLADAVFVCLAAGALIYGVSRLPQQSYEGATSVIDGDSLRVDGEEIRLFGIDAPEFSQSCNTADGAPWTCGRAARAHLRSLVHSKTVTCTSHAVDRYDRALSRCRAGETDLNAEMIRAGLAVATVEGTALYGRAEAEAKAAKRGIWQGDFTRPGDWRERNR